MAGEYDDFRGKEVKPAKELRSSAIIKYKCSFMQWLFCMSNQKINIKKTARGRRSCRKGEQCQINFMQSLALNNKSLGDNGLVQMNMLITVTSQ